jgi:hypothetical protein
LRERLRAGGKICVLYCTDTGVRGSEERWAVVPFNGNKGAAAPITSIYELGKCIVFSRSTGRRLLDSATGTPWEVTGYVHNAVFSYGAVPEPDETVKIYWGGAGINEGFSQLLLRNSLKKV